MTKPQASLETGRVLEAVLLTASAQEKIGALSHGMAKRVAIAQALIGNPELILLDEPTAGLDPINVRTVRAIIAEQSSATTFLISSHDLSELDRLCRRILLLEKGVCGQRLRTSMNIRAPPAVKLAFLTHKNHVNDAFRVVINHP